MTAATLSMTGFGEGRSADDRVEVAVELKSVNHRFLDIVTRMPPAYSRFDAEVARIIRGSVKRGRVDVFVSRHEMGESDYEVHFNRPLFDKYLTVVQEAFQAAAVSPGDGQGAAVLNILGKREVLELVPKEENSDGEYALLEHALLQAVGMLVEMRRGEGRQLETEVLGLLGSLEGIVGRVQQIAEHAPEDLKTKLIARLERLSPELNIEAERLAQEAAIVADKVDVTEEIFRLRSHFLQFRQIVKDGEGGRKLEFLLQEFGREINTIGSKSQNAEITALVVEAKAATEKMKEQIANIE